MTKKNKESKTRWEDFEHLIERLSPWEKAKFEEEMKHPIIRVDYVVTEGIKGRDRICL
jgi:hypothetical protein